MNQQSLQLPNSLFLEEVRRNLQAGHTVKFRVRGWSMRPFLEHARDKVLLVSPERHPVQVNDVALVLADDGRYVLHRVVEIDGEGNVTLWGDGNVVGRETARPDNIIGVAEAFYIGEKEKYRPVTGRAWRWHTWFWMHTTWLRRYLLFAYRVWRKVFPAKQQ